jgi:hypothetical protein
VLKSTFRLLKTARARGFARNDSMPFLLPRGREARSIAHGPWNSAVAARDSDPDHHSDFAFLALARYSAAPG